MIKPYSLILLTLFSFGAVAVSKDTSTSVEQTIAEQFETSLATLRGDSSPYKLVQSIGTKVFQSVSRAKALSGDQEQLMSIIIEKQLMPFIDVTFASYKVLGSQLKKSTKAERLLFVEAMRQNLVATYSSALAQYTDQEIRYEQEKSVTGKRSVSVKIELIAANKPNIDMLFKLRKSKKTGEWKAYDLVVEGISLVNAKRAELAGLIRQHGIEHVATEILN